MPGSPRRRRVTRWVLSSISLIVVVTAGCTFSDRPGGGNGTGSGATSTGGSGGAVPAPKQGAYFGAWVKPLTLNQEERYAAVQERERTLGRQFDVVHTYRTWHEDFPRESDNRFLASNRYLMLSWNGIDTKKIVSGRQDHVIRERARAIKGTGKALFLRWQWEMERPNIRYRIHSPADYIAAWRHIRKVFASENVENAAWVWCPTAKGFPADRAADYYPGDAYVDWICTDAYPGIQYGYRDLSEVMAPFMAWAAKRPKPIMVGEFGVPRTYGARRAEWLRKATKVLRNPQIKAVLYFDSDQEGKVDDARLAYALDGDSAAMSAMRELAASPHFNPRRLPVAER
jgi:hypothetical protein